jgi:hypothetical protein
MVAFNVVTKEIGSSIINTNNKIKNGEMSSIDYSKIVGTLSEVYGVQMLTVEVLQTTIEEELGKQVSRNLTGKNILVKANQGDTVTTMGASYNLGQFGGKRLFFFFSKMMT